LVYNGKALIYNCIVVDIAKSYSNHPLHAKVGGIIRAHSENKIDIRDIVKKMIEWKDVRRIIDLGCGYGWFEETLKDAIKEALDLAVGVDCLVENADPFIRNAKKVAKEAVFKVYPLPATIDFPSDYFDLVICAYSLYFFPGILPEVKRILRKGGVFVVITHSETMLEEGKRFFDFKNLRTVIEQFSAENGDGTLREHFQHITSVDYRNSLIFYEGDEEDLALYIDFKREFIRKDADPDLVRDTMIHELYKNGEFRLSKNDKIFLVKK
jgi:SAM-dependent methyltransferase